MTWTSIIIGVAIWALVWQSIAAALDLENFEDQFFSAFWPVAVVISPLLLPLWLGRAVGEAIKGWLQRDKLPRAEVRK